MHYMYNGETKKGQEYFLFPFSREFIAKTGSNYKNWFYDEEITKNNHHGLFPYGKEKFDKYLDMCESGKEEIVLGVAISNELFKIDVNDDDFGTLNGLSLTDHDQDRQDIAYKAMEKHNSKLVEGFNENPFFCKCKNLDIREYIHIGNISLQRINFINGSAEFAIVMDKEYHGQGFATEALHKLIDHGFNKLNLHRIWSGTAKTNIGMQKVFKKLGMVQEGVFKDATFLNGKYEDIVCFAILEDEWRKQNGI